MQVRLLSLVRTVVLVNVAVGMPIRSKNEDSSELQLAEFVARRSDLDDSTSESNEDEFKSRFAVRKHDDDDIFNDQLRDLRAEKDPMAPEVPASGAPNLFNLPGLSENHGKGVTFVEGDIAISRDRNAYRENPKWAGGVIPYTIDSVFTAAQQATIKSAMAAISAASDNCIRFVPQGSHPVWLRIHSGSGCWSSMGKAVTSGAQDLSLQQFGCTQQPTITHELLHAVGFAHEQTRPDRDRYVTIYSANIISGKEHNFQRYSTSQIDTLGEPYDYGSIMHYPSTAFTSNGKPTIRPSLAGYENWESYIGHGEKMSKGDIRKIKKYYNCA